jgi:hypothetical protein
VAPSEAGTIRGRVVDADTNAPIGGILVMARSGTGTASARSSDDGDYEIGGLASQAYALSVGDPGYVEWTRKRVTVRATDSVSVDVELVRGAGLCGRVIDEDGRGIEGAVGLIHRAAESPEHFMMVWHGPEAAGSVTNPDGGFHATRLVPGANREIEVSHDGYEHR